MRAAGIILQLLKKHCQREQHLKWHLLALYVPQNNTCKRWQIPCAVWVVSKDFSTAFVRETPVLVECCTATEKSCQQELYGNKISATSRQVELQKKTTKHRLKTEDGQQTWAPDMSAEVTEMCHWNGDRGNRSPSVSNKTKMHFPIWDHRALLSWSGPAFTQAQQSHRGWNRPMFLSSLKRSRDNHFSHC